MSPHTHHNTTAIQPSPTMTNRHHTHATAYGTRQNPPSAAPIPHTPPGHARAGMRNSTEPTRVTPTIMTNPTTRMSRHAQHDTSPAGHRRPRQSTPINTDDQHRSNQASTSTDIDDHPFWRLLVEHFAIHIATHIHAARRGFVLVLPWTYQVHVPYLNVIGSVVSQILKIEGLI